MDPWYSEGQSRKEPGAHLIHPLPFSDWETEAGERQAVLGRDHREVPVSPWASVSPSGE